jgi:hypothetical protein
VVSVPTDEGYIPVAGNANRNALKCTPNTTCANKLIALLAPRSVSASEYPDSSCVVNSEVVKGPADEGCVPVGRKSDRAALICAPGNTCACTDKFAPLWAPYTPSACEYPRGTCKIIVPISTDNRRVPVCGERNRTSLLRKSLRISNSTRTNQFISLLAPHAPSTNEHPRRSDTTAVPTSAYNRRISVGRKSDRRTLLGTVDCACADEFVPLLAPHTAITNEHPCRSDTTAVSASTHNCSIPIRGKGNRDALVGYTNCIRPDQFASQLTPNTTAPCEDPRCTCNTTVAPSTHNGSISI